MVLDWLNYENQKQDATRAFLALRRYRINLARNGYRVQLQFAFTLMSLYTLYPDRIEEIDASWQYHCGNLVMGF